MPTRRMVLALVRRRDRVAVDGVDNRIAVTLRLLLHVQYQRYLI